MPMLQAQNDSDRQGLDIEAQLSSHHADACSGPERRTIQEYTNQEGAHGYRDGTTHIVLEPLDLMARLAALVPPPRMHLRRFHGVFAPHSKLRAAVTPAHRCICCCARNSLDIIERTATRPSVRSARHRSAYTGYVNSSMTGISFGNGRTWTACGKSLPCCGAPIGFNAVS
jgi:hypothetical protein